MGLNRTPRYKTYETVPRVFMQTLVTGVWGAWRGYGVGGCVGWCADVPTLKRLVTAKILADATDFRTVAGGGKYKVVDFPADYAALNRPVATRGVLDVSPLSSSNRVLTYKTYENVPRVFICACVSGVWGPWW